MHVVEVYYYHHTHSRLSLVEQLMWVRIERPSSHTLYGNQTCINNGGYANEGAGWADAEGSIGFLARGCVEAGISFVTGERGTVTELVTALTKQQR